MRYGERVEEMAGAIAQGATLVKRVVSCVFGADGCLYMLDYGETWGANKDAKLIKISYQRGHLAAHRASERGDHRRA